MKDCFAPPLPLDVGQLTACGPRSGNVQALELPTAGKLSYMDTVLNATLVDLGSPSTTFQYVPFECNPQLRDSFLVQLGPTAVVQVKVVGCVTRGSQLLILVALVVLVVPLLFGPGFVHWRQTRHQRDNSRAPKDTSRPIGVLFTDIQASTLLWGEAPELMAQALDVHHDVIRAAIRKHRCYEVKTIGDSFMVVSEDPVALLRLALAIQEALYDHDWGHEAFDDVYRRQTGCALRAEAYGRRWHGLRVRIGVHYGPAQVTFDETTKGYDYYGNVVNTAARIEGAGHGGQVLMSREAHEQVADHYGALDVHAQPLGYVQLRGVRAPLDLIQILPARFADRTFPPLRTDHAGDEDDASEDGLSSGYEQSGKSERVYPQAFDRDVLTHPLVRTGAVSSEVAAFHAHSVFYTLRSQLNMVQNSDERRKWLRDLCRKWHVPCHSVGEDQENGTLGRLTLQLMGSVVTQMRSKQRANSFLSQGIVSPGVVASPPMSPTPVIMMPSPSRKYFHSVQVYPVLDSP